MALMADLKKPEISLSTMTLSSLTGKETNKERIKLLINSSAFLSKPRNREAVIWQFTEAGHSLSQASLHSFLLNGSFLPLLV